MELDSGNESMSIGAQVPNEAVMDITERTRLQNSSSSGNIVGTISGFTRLPEAASSTADGDDEKEEKAAEKSGDEKDSDKPKLSRREFIKSIILAALMLTAALLVNACFSVIAPFYPKEARSRGVSNLMVGFVLGVTPLTVAVVSPLFGYFLPELGVKFLLVSGLTLVGGPYILMAFLHQLSSTLEFLVLSLALRIVEGVGSAAFYTASFTVATVLFPSSTGTIMGLMELASAVGFLIGPPVGGLLYQADGFRLPFLVSGSSAMLFVFVFLILLPRAETTEKKCISLKTVFKLVTNIQFFMLLMVIIVSETGLVFYMPNLTLFMTKTFGCTIFEAGLTFLPVPVAYMLSAVVVGALSDKLGPRWIVCSGLLIIGVMYIFVGPAPFILSRKLLPLTLVAFGGIGAACAMGITPVYSNLLELAKKIDPHSNIDQIHGIVSGIISATLFFGEFLGPLIGGAMSAIYPFDLSSALFGEGIFAFGVLFSGISLVDYYVDKRDEKRRKKFEQFKLKEKANQ